MLYFAESTYQPVAVGIPLEEALLELVEMSQDVGEANEQLLAEAYQVYAATKELNEAEATTEKKSLWKRAIEKLKELAAAAGRQWRRFISALISRIQTFVLKLAGKGMVVPKGTFRFAVEVENTILKIMQAAFGYFKGLKVILTGSDAEAEVAAIKENHEKVQAAIEGARKGLDDAWKAVKLDDKSERLDKTSFDNMTKKIQAIDTNVLKLSAELAQAASTLKAEDPETEKKLAVLRGAVNVFSSLSSLIGQKLSKIVSVSTSGAKKEEGEKDAEAKPA